MWWIFSEAGGFRGTKESLGPLSLLIEVAFVQSKRTNPKPPVYSKERLINRGYSPEPEQSAATELSSLLSLCTNKHFLPTFVPGQEFLLPALLSVSLMYVLAALSP